MMTISFLRIEIYIPMGGSTCTWAFIGSEGKFWSQKGGRCDGFDSRTIQAPDTDSNTGIYGLRGKSM